MKLLGLYVYVLFVRGSISALDVVAMIDAKAGTDAAVPAGFMKRTSVSDVIFDSINLPYN